MSQTQPRPEESRRFGSRAFARRLVEDSGRAAPSGRHTRSIERAEAPVMVAPAARVSRRRLLPFEVLLTGAGGTQPLFRPGPFDELRCFQRRVEGTQRHELEFLTWLAPQDRGSEGYRAFGVLRLDEAEPLVDLRRQQSFWLRLRAERGLRTLPQARVEGPRREPGGLPREGLLRILPALGSGGYRRDGQPDLEPRDVLEIVRARASGLERVAWMEEAFRAPSPAGMALHRYYLDADLTAYLVRQEGMQKTICALVPSDEARARGLLIYPRQRPVMLAA
ncbi:MAG: hypothetical protein AB7N76_14945 [Planctomycetota bacterium]